MRRVGRDQSSKIRRVKAISYGRSKEEVRPSALTVGEMGDMVRIKNLEAESKLLIKQENGTKMFHESMAVLSKSHLKTA